MVPRIFLALAGTATAFVLATAHPGSASGSAVLTTGGPGGAAAAVGDTLTAPLASGTSATFYSSANGTSGAVCKASQFTAAVTGNPAAPGKATESVIAHTFDTKSCTSNISGVLAVDAVTIDNLPYKAEATSDRTLSVLPDSGSHIQATIKLRTVVGAVTCVYQAMSLTGRTDNTDSGISFVNQHFSKSAGSSLCPSDGYFTARYAPVTDGGARVYVN
ncbi:Tat pathway signal sequence domain protein [Streptomyces sp. NPDC020800]|uniref:Tat pathway signal sequence domain protein n=1 Tax=Streptomyces sp. NPDC020800 TaxID=3365092 RepID=UPI00378F9451